MKTKTRNRNYKARLLRNSCILAAGVLGISGAAAGILSNASRKDAFATNQTVRRTGLSGIGENEIQMISSVINLTNANIVTTGSQIKKQRSKCYTTAEMQNGTYDSERSSQVSYFTATENYCDALNIVYDFGDSLARGMHSVDGTISLTWSEAARDADRHTYDVKMYIDNISVANGTAATRPISLMAEREHAVRYATQEVDASGLSGDKYALVRHDVGASYDVLVSVVDHTTGEPVANKKTVYQMKDLDQADHYPDNENGGLYTDTDGSTPKPFAEGITLISGIDQEVFVGNNSLLNITNTHFGDNTRYSAMRTTDDDEWELSSVAFRGDAAGFKYRWYGSDCGTMFGWIGAKKVVTSTSGTYKDHGRITPTDDEVLWKEDKSISAVPNTGYYVSKLTVDGQDVQYTAGANGRVTHVLEDVVADHTVDAQFMPYRYKVTVHHYRVGTTDSVAPDVVEENHINGDTYTSSVANAAGYHVVEKPESENVTFVDRDIELIYYYSKNYKVTVHHYKAGTTDPVAPDVVEDDHVEGDTYTSEPVNVDGYQLVERPAEEKVTFTDHDIELIYYYGENGDILVEYCDTETKKCDIAPSETDEGVTGEKSEICVEKKIDGYNFVNREGDACVYDKDTTNIKYWYKKIQNPDTATGSISGYASAVLGLASAILGSVFFITKNRRK